MPCGGVGQGVQLVPHEVGALSLTHISPQRCIDGPQGVRHSPISQRDPVGQRFPHAPQCEGSVAMSTHASPHAVDRPIGHTHAPPRHSLPDAPHGEFAGSSSNVHTCANGSHCSLTPHGSSGQSRSEVHGRCPTHPPTGSHRPPPPHRVDCGSWSHRPRTHRSSVHPTRSSQSRSETHSMKASARSVEMSPRASTAASPVSDGGRSLPEHATTHTAAAKRATRSSGAQGEWDAARSGTERQRGYTVPKERARTINRPARR